MTKQKEDAIRAIEEFLNDNDGVLTQIYEIDEILFLYKLHQYILEQKEPKIHQNKKWVKYSLQDFYKLMPFWSSSKVARMAKKLKDEETILTKKLINEKGNLVYFCTINYQKITEKLNTFKES